MKNNRRPIVMTYILVWTLLFSTLAFGQTTVKGVSTERTNVQDIEQTFANYLMEVAGTPATEQIYSREVQTIARMLSSNNSKNPVLIDNQGYAREDRKSTRLNSSHG